VRRVLNSKSKSRSLRTAFAVARAKPKSKSKSKSESKPKSASRREASVDLETARQIAERALESDQARKQRREAGFEQWAGQFKRYAEPGEYEAFEHSDAFKAAEAAMAARDAAAQVKAEAKFQALVDQEKKERELRELQAKRNMIMGLFKPK
jgi:hypothetical protein